MQREEYGFWVENIATCVECECQVEVETSFSGRFLELVMLPASGGIDEADICPDRSERPNDYSNCQEWTHRSLFPYWVHHSTRPLVHRNPGYFRPLTIFSTFSLIMPR